MLTVESLKKTESLLAGLLFFFLPTQLAYFFWPNWSYFWGIKIDFLSPTVFFTDVIILFLGLFWFLRLVTFSLKWPWEKPVWWPFWGTMSLLFINVLLAYRPLLAGYRLIKWGELIFLFIYFKHNFSPRFLLYLFFGLLITISLAWGQFLAQESLQGIFWWLGERFFNPSTLGVAKMDLFSRLFVRPMATFSHPNSLAGFVLVSVAIFWQFKDFLVNRLGVFFYLGLIIISTVLVITFSAAIWLTILITCLLFIARRLKRWWFWSMLVFGLIVLAYLINYFDLIESQSILERLFLAHNAWRLFIRRPILGWGLGNFIPAQSELLLSRGGFNFYQPVHNLFLLVLTEAGILGLAISLFWLKRLWSNIDNKWRMIVFLVIVSGFFDHYWLTLQQNFLLLGLVSAIALSVSSYNGLEVGSPDKPSCFD